MSTTTKATHTPGPWRVWEESARVYIEAGTQMPEPGVVGTRTIAALDRAAHGPNEAVANARLIAAAPDLLAACKYADRECMMPALVRDAVRAAIAKAEGGAA